MLYMMKEQEAKNIVVVGASSGLGKAFAVLYAEQGDNVYAVSRSIEQHELPEEIERIKADITDPVQVKDIFERVSSEVEAIDLVITTVGLGLVKNFEQTSIEEIERVTSIGLLGPMLIAREAYTKMLPQGFGQIVTVSSTTGLEGKPQEVVYSAVKQGLRGMNQALHKEAAEHNIESICIFPGGMSSENFWSQAAPGKDVSTYMKPSTVAEKIIVELNKPSPHPTEILLRRES